MAEDGVVLEVEAGAEVVEKLAELEHFALVCDVVAAAGGLVVVEADVVAAVVFEGVADVEPFVGEGESGTDEGFEVALDGVAECLEIVGVGDVEGVGDGEEVAKFGAQIAEVEVAGSIGSLVLD